MTLLFPRLLKFSSRLDSHTRLLPQIYYIPPIIFKLPWIKRNNFVFLSSSTLLKAFLIRNALLVQTQLLCPQVPQLKTWGQRKQEEHEAGEVEIDCPTQLAILYSFDDTLIVSEQVGKKAQQEQA